MNQLKLKVLRARIDLLDRLFLTVLSRRMYLVEQIGTVKRSLVSREKHSSGRMKKKFGRWAGGSTYSPFLDKARKKQVLKKWSRTARQLGLRNGFVCSLYESVHNEAILRQSKKRK